MKDLYSQSSSPDNHCFTVDSLRFGVNGPYTFHCPAGECLGVSGDSGVGKTLLLRALADLDRNTGDISLDGKSCSAHQAPDWRRLVAMVPAEPRWWYEDVSSHLPVGYDRLEVHSLVESCGFEPDVLSWHVSRLSTGEKQRLAVVRTLVRKPAVLLLDETGSGLDRRNALLLEEVIKTYQGVHGAPVIWVSHDGEQLERVSGRVMTLNRNSCEISPRRTQRNKP